MKWQLAFWLVNVISFWGYAIGTIIAQKKLPYSWSITYYDLENKKKNKGSILSIILTLFVFSMVPVAIESYNIMFLPLAMIAFIAAAPAYRGSKLENIVHMTGSITSVLSAIFIIIILYKFYIIGSILLLIVLLLYFKLVKVKSHINIIESITILSSQIIVLCVNILNINYTWL